MRIKYLILLFFILISCKKQEGIFLQSYGNTSFSVYNGTHTLIICNLTEEGKIISFQLKDQHGNKIIFNYDEKSLLSFSVEDENLGYKLINNYVMSKNIFIDRYEVFQEKKQQYTINSNLEISNYYQEVQN